MEHGDRYGQRTSPTPTETYTERPAVALKEISLRLTWRKAGTAHRIDDALLVTRDEPYVTLMANPAAGDGKIHALHKTWGYVDIGTRHNPPSGRAAQAPFDGGLPSHRLRRKRKGRSPPRCQPSG